MPANTKVIKRRIKSIKNTSKITKAMELVAASKMRRAIAATLATLPYSELAWNTITEISRVTKTSLHPLLKKPKQIKKILIVFVSSDRGLCGGYNAQLVRTFLALYKKNKEQGIEQHFVTCGKKAAAFVRKAKEPLIASFVDLSNNPTNTDIQPIAKIILNEFTKGTYQQVFLAFTDFISTLRQSPEIQQLLPLKRIEKLGEIEQEKNKPLQGMQHPTTGARFEYLFEPSPRAVLDSMLPRLIEIQLFQAILESTASEHSARMIAMRSASDAAGEMIEDLTFTYNQIRQSGITQEIAEIAAGAAALN